LVVSVTSRPLYPQEREQVPRAPGPVWTGAENLAPTWIRSLDRPARRESPNRLRCPGPPQMCNMEADHSSTSGTEFENDWIHTYTNPVC